MPRYSDYNETAVVRGGYVPRRLNVQGPSIEVFSHALDKIDARHKEALAERNKIMAAVGQLDLNEAEDEFKIDYIRDIQNQIDAASEFGGYSTALTTATQLAGNVLTDPRITGRIKAQQEYKAAKDRVQSRTDIGQVTKDRWLEENPYTYQDKYDANGNVVGGTGFKANWNPVRRVDLTDIYKRVKDLVATEAGGSENAMFLDENMQLTNDITKGFYGMAVKRGTTWERLSEDKLKQAFDSIFKQTPDALESVMQDRDDRIWQYNKSDDEGKKAFIGSDIMGLDGTIYSPSQYLANKANPVLHDMAFDHTSTTVDYGSAYSNAMKDLKDRAAAKALVDLDKMQNTTMSVPIEIDLSERAASSYATIMNAFKNVNDLWKGTNVTKSKEYSDLVNNRNYDGIADYLERNITTKDPAKASAARIAIRQLRSEGNIFKAFIDGMDDKTREAIEFRAAVASGAPLPNAKYNRYSRDYAKLKNNVFSYSIGGTTKPTDKIGFEFSSESDFTSFVNRLGISKGELSKYGLGAEVRNGKTVLTVSNTSPILNKVADVTFDGTRPQSYIRTGVYTPNGFVYKDLKGTPWSSFRQLTSDNGIFKDATEQSDAGFAINTAVKSIEPLQIKPGQDLNISTLDEMAASGQIDPQTWKDWTKNFTENNLKAFAGAVVHLGNYAVYGQRDENGNAVRLTPKEVEENKEKIQIALADGRVTLSPTDAPTTGNYGTIVQIAPKVDSKNKVIDKGGIFYIDALFDGAASRAFASDEKVLYNHEFKKLRAIGAKVMDFEGKPIDYSTNGDGPRRLQLTRKLDEVRTKIDQTRRNGGVIKPEDVQDTAVSLLMNAGYIDSNGRPLVSQNYLSQLLQEVQGIINNY